MKQSYSTTYKTLTLIKNYLILVIALTDVEYKV